MKTDCIIYSKDRACQLDLLLRSIKDNFCHNDIYVLYDYSANHEQSYNKLMAKNYEMNIAFVRQTRDTFANVLRSVVKNNIKTEYVCPLCDDDVFIRKTDIEDISKYVDEKTIGIHLRFSKDLTISYHTGKTFDLPKFYHPFEYMNWDWTEYPIIDRWGYAYQAGGLIYKTSFFKHMIDSTSFFLPNSLETAMMQNRSVWGKNMILGFHKSPIVNVSVNRVQHDVNNRGGRDVNYKIDDLSNVFLSDLIIDESCLYNYENNCEFIEIKLNFKENK